VLSAFPKSPHDSRFEEMKARPRNYGELRPMIERVVSKMTRGRSHGSVYQR
jgi:hypothetical protein